MLVAPWSKDSRELEDCVQGHKTSTRWKAPTHKFVCQATDTHPESRVMCDVAMSFAMDVWKVGEFDFCYPLTPVAAQCTCPLNLSLTLEVEAVDGWRESIRPIRGRLGPEHQNCDPWRSLRPSLEQIWGSVGTVPDQKAEYMLEQAKLSGLCREEGARSRLKRAYDQVE